METALIHLPEDETTAERNARLLLGAMLVNAGMSHLTFAREDFKAQVLPG